MALTADSLLQNERAEQLRSLSFLAGILLSFGMAALYQLVFEPDSFAAGTKIFYAVTIALTVSLFSALQAINALHNMEMLIGSSKLLHYTRDYQHKPCCPYRLQ